MNEQASARPMWLLQKSSSIAVWREKQELHQPGPNGIWWTLRPLKFSGLMKQWLNSVAWKPSAMSGGNLAPLITEPVPSLQGSMAVAASCCEDAFWQQELGDQSGWRGRSIQQCTETSLTCSRALWTWDWDSTRQRPWAQSRDYHVALGPVCECLSISGSQRSEESLTSSAKKNEPILLEGWTMSTCGRSEALWILSTCTIDFPLWQLCWRWITHLKLQWREGEALCWVSSPLIVPKLKLDRV